MAECMVANSGVGDEIRKYLVAALSLPEGLRWFEVRFAHDEIVTVKCEYFPQTEATPRQDVSPVRHEETTEKTTRDFTHWRSLPDGPWTPTVKSSGHDVIPVRRDGPDKPWQSV